MAARKRLLIGLVFVCVVFLGGAVGCQKASENGAPSATAILMQEDQFFRLCEMGIKTAAQQQGIQLSVMNSFGAVDKEMDIIDTSIARGVKAIVIAPISPESSVASLRRAAEKGISIIVYDNDLKADFCKSAIRSDQTGLGKATGEYARKFIETQLGGQAKLALIEYMALSSETSGIRTSGFKSQLEGLPGVQIVAEQDAWLAPQATDVVESLLTAHPEINVIWAANEGGTVGAVKAVINTGNAGKVHVFGTDISEQIADMLLAGDGVLKAVTGQKGYDIGFSAMNAAVKALKGEPVERHVEMPGTLYTRDNPESVQAYRQQLQQLSQ